MRVYVEHGIFARLLKKLEKIKDASQLSPECTVVILRVK